MRKLPIYILLDTSGSMRGEPIEAVKTGLQSLLSSLRRDPYAMETVYISIITFDREARILSPMTELSAFSLPEIPPLESSPTNLGEALELMCQCYDREVVKSTDDQKGDWLPLAVVMTDGSPSDTMLFEEMCDRIRQYRFAHIIGCAAGPKAKSEPLRKFATDVVTLETMDSNAFSQFWQWVSLAVSRQSQTTDLNQEELPPPPPEIKLAI
ncbi:tellurium resistance protein TerY [Deltaproteobacteria bacterium Smac51]|nr:tellurium resistance protein TerY [Deltaproteobacteria bacterium Smac51]